MPQTNGNGAFVTYTVPPGKPLKVWEGETASQTLKDRAGAPVKADDKGNYFVLDQTIWTKPISASASRPPGATTISANI